MKYNLLFGFAFTIACSANSQTVSHTVVSSEGGFTQTSGGSIAWTIGEPVSESYVAGSNITTMGFHQPDISIIQMIREQGEESEILIYPNPVKEVIRINFSGLPNGLYALELVDAIGKLIYSSDADISESSKEANIKVNEYAAGIYFLRIHNKNLNKTVKVNKVN